MKKHELVAVLCSILGIVLLIGLFVCVFAMIGCVSNQTANCKTKAIIIARGAKESSMEDKNNLEQTLRWQTQNPEFVIGVIEGLLILKLPKEFEGQLALHNTLKPKQFFFFELSGEFYSTRMAVYNLKKLPPGNYFFEIIQLKPDGISVFDLGPYRTYHGPVQEHKGALFIEVGVYEVSS